MRYHCFTVRVESRSKDPGPPAKILTTQRLLVYRYRTDLIIEKQWLPAINIYKYIN